MDLQLNFRKSELVFDVFLIALGGVLFWQSAITKATVEEPLTAAMYGMAISGLFLVMMLARFFKMVASKQAEDDSKFVINHFALIVFAAAFALAYTIGIVKVGYYVTTLIFTTVMIMILREKEERTAKTWIITVTGCLLFTVALYFLFKTFKVYLPNAWLI